MRMRTAIGTGLGLAFLLVAPCQALGWDEHGASGGRSSSAISEDPNPLGCRVVPFTSAWERRSGVIGDDPGPLNRCVQMQLTRRQPEIGDGPDPIDPGSLRITEDPEPLGQFGRRIDDTPDPFNGFSLVIIDDANPVNYVRPIIVDGPEPVGFLNATYFVVAVLNSAGGVSLIIGTFADGKWTPLFVVEPTASAQLGH